ncbi:recombinase family protein [Hymenobacter lapidiphilus]|uniref:recombinase family protein n=1 Tax=Hymenobacter sp. CCM 8763 TaxID=2303334 RepID=UPI000E354C16|nr:recombinase family protein [Hymenobacter sp. CCM 8763]RFP64302.1 recombinase family protein [Hymenobacter sp. CCM 8763]
MKIGYAHVSTRDQNVELQLDALTQAGCELIYQEKASGALAARVELDKLLLQVRPGDTVYLYKLDRLGRSLKHLLDLVADLQRRDIGLISLTDAINTSSVQGRLVLNLFASLAEFERELIREHTLAGLAAAAWVGASPASRKKPSARPARRNCSYNARALSVDDMARSLRICKATFYTYLHHRGVTLRVQPLPSPVATPTT